MRVRKIQELLSEADRGEILLPNFQREYAYERKKQASLIASVLTGIPLGSVLMLKGSHGFFHSRNIGRISSIQLKTNYPHPYFLLDGQQRITTLWNVFTDIYATRDSNELYQEVHNFLKSRWFIRFKVNFEIEDDFGDDIWGLKFFTIKDRLINELSPESVEDYIHYVLHPNTDKFNWPNSLNFVINAAANPVGSKLFREYIDHNWALPLHLLFDRLEVRRYINNVAKMRANSILQRVDEWAATNRNYLDFNDFERELLRKTCNVNGAGEWITNNFSDMRAYVEGKSSEWADSIVDYFSVVSETQISVVELDDSFLSKAHVVFDVINKSGEKLTAFDLFCASKPGIDVRSLVNDAVPRDDNFGLRDQRTELSSDEFAFQLMNLIRVTDALSRNDEITSSTLKSNRIFTMTSIDLALILDRSLEALLHAYKFLKSDLGVRKLSEIPYKLQVLPIALGFYLNMERNFIKYWYWLSLFSGRYRELQNTRVTKDLELFAEYHRDPSTPKFNDYRVYGSMWDSLLAVQHYNDLHALVPQANTEVEFRTSMRQAILSFVLSLNPVDFPPSSAQRLNTDSETQAHHILPLASSVFSSRNLNSIKSSTLEIRKDPTHFLNSPLNLTLISDSSNNRIGAMSYSDYSSAFDAAVIHDHALPSQIATLTEDEQRNWLKERHRIVLDKLKNVLRGLN
jgi:hypothetical protein